MSWDEALCDEVIKFLKTNTTPMKFLSEQERDFFDKIPAEDCLYLGPGGDWFQCDGPGRCLGVVYMLRPNWERPKMMIESKVEIEKAVVKLHADFSRILDIIFRLER
jgi:hypothetical protein